MFCPHCNAKLPAKATVCFFCGETVPLHTLRLPHQKRCRKFTVTPLLRSPRFVRAITPKTGTPDLSLNKAHKQIDTLIAQARMGTVTYESLFRALLLDYDHNNRFMNELSMYYDAYDTWIDYSELLTRDTAKSLLLPQFNLLREDMPQTALDALGCETALTTHVLSYPGLKRWLMSCMVTMLFMDLARTGQLTTIPSDDFLTLEIRFGSGLWQEQLLLAQKANPYTLSWRTDQDAIEAFIHDHDSQVGMQRKEQLQHVLLGQIALGLLYGQIHLCEASVITRFLLKKLDEITKDYELILFLDLIKTKWTLFATLEVSA